MPYSSVTCASFISSNETPSVNTRFGNPSRKEHDFVANVSHELRTPLTIIRGYTEALRDGTVTDPEQVGRFNALIVSETERLERLISDLLDQSRLQAQQQPMEFEASPLAEVADSVSSMLRGKAAEKVISSPVRGCLK